MHTLVIVVLASAFSHAESVGEYWNGRLKTPVNAHQIFRKHSRSIEPLSPPAYQYAHRSMVDAALDLAKWVRDYTGGSRRLQIGDISLRKGGRLARHQTHQIGLDADIAYLSTHRPTGGHRANRFHNKFRETFVRKGRLSQSFDVAGNFALLVHLIKNHDVLKIYVGCEIKSALANYNPPPHWRKDRNELLARLVPDRTHTDHFHVRLGCPDDSPRCVDDELDPGERRCS